MCFEWNFVYSLVLEFLSKFLGFVPTTRHSRLSLFRLSEQGVIQDFEVEGGNEKSNQKMLLKKGQPLFQYPAMDTQS